MKVQEPGRQQEANGKKLGTSHDRGHSFRVHGMRGEQQRGQKRNGRGVQGRFEQPLQKKEQQRNHAGVQKDVEQVIAKRLRPLEFPIKSERSEDRRGEIGCWRPGDEEIPPKKTGSQPDCGECTSSRCM